MFERHQLWDSAIGIDTVGEYVLAKLLEMGLKVSAAPEVYNILYGNILIVPHISWIGNGFSGLSIPPFIVLDYEDVVFALVVKGTEKNFLASTYASKGIRLPSEEAIHYKPNKKSGAVCGRTVIGHLGLKLNEVTCKNCLSEITLALEAASSAVN